MREVVDLIDLAEGKSNNDDDLHWRRKISKIFWNVGNFTTLHGVTPRREMCIVNPVKI